MLSKEIGTVSGVGKQRERLFFRLGIKTVEDMLCYYPRNYEDRSKIKSISETTDGESVCVKAVACTVMSSKRVRRGLSYQKLTVTDGTGVLFITWFNHDWLVKGFDLSAEYIYYGKISVKNGRVEVSNPVIVKDNKIEPIYPLTNGLTQNIFRAVMKNCLPFADEIPEALPERIRENHTLCGIDYAIRNVHFPQSFEKFDFARKRLAFEELFLLQLGLRMLRQRRGVQKGTPLCNDDNVDSFLSGLSFPLTNAQIRVKDEIISDLKKSRAMNRLVQGDVGSGKTVVAAVALLVAAKSGAQAAMMAPTEILAKQHYDNLSEMYNKMSIKTALLTGSLTASQKREICEKTQSGEIQIIIGTHTLIQDSISFKNLCLVVTDEQHRFGVKQRAALAEKGKAPHLLVMTATPIPRTLSLVLYGDLDVSVIDELPPGRKMIDTYAVGEEMRERINQFVLKQINEGRQVYIICPLVEEGEATELKAVREYAKSLREGAFAGRSVGVIHGRLKTKEKDAVMQSFADGKIDILVSTTVVEVGVNIPNASLMIIEDAQRFGLSQLHQLRGRVGRGQWKSYCIMFYQGGGATKERMDIMCKTNDGFLIAEKDLELRGSGEFFGTRQHGLPELKIANLYSDMDIVAESGKAAEDVLEGDNSLLKPENSAIKQKVEKLFEQAGNNEFN